MLNSKPPLELQDFVTKAISEMVEVGAASAISIDVKPTDASPLAIVPKPHSNKSRLIINMRYANDHLVKRVFKFERLSDIADMADRGNYSMSSDLTSGYCHVTLLSDSRHIVGFK
jgi:hypothetical protein